ncbi:phage-related exonuclease [uncultured Candidatus Thioglobus sp.]|nr:phage-related exonuclease [uncultured Candidatus Thioglobus sp.]
MKCKFYDPRPPKYRQTSSKESSEFLANLKATAPSSSFVHVLHDPSAVSSSTPTTTPLPPIPKSCVERVRYMLKSLPQPPSRKNILDLGQELISRLTVDDLAAIEKATVGQSLRKRWHEERFGRLTASNFGRVCKVRKVESMAIKLLYAPSSVLSSSAIQWGKDHEDEARKQYQATLPPGHCVRECGIFIHSTSGYLAASPDGLVFRDGEKGILEIKCPFSFRSKSSILEAIDNNKCLFCHIDEETKSVMLKRNHDYFYQVQGQMAVVGAQWCDFVIWAPAFFHIERISYDDTFWKNKCLPQLSSFYKFVLSPELLYPRHNSGLNILDYSLLC